jgi:uncharacterized metal-binding protein YceD (DUF177 family)
MKISREFEIAWQGLKPGVHNYQFTLDDAFMQAKSAPAEFFNWKASVGLRFDKHESFFMLHFDVGGTVTTPCDRCGDDFELKLWDEFDLLVKLSGEEDDRNEDEDADVVFVPRHETVIDISDWIYEFVMLAVPLQRIHPERPDGTPGCNPEALRLLGDLAAKEAESNEPSEELQPANSIWKGLQNISVQDEEADETKPSKKSEPK